MWGRGRVRRMSEPGSLPVAQEKSPLAVASGSHPKYGPFARRLLSGLFDPVAFPAEATAPLVELSRKATPVYVLRSSSLLHLLYFNYTFARLGLPVARAATGLGYRI